MLSLIRLKNIELTQVAVSQNGHALRHCHLRKFVLKNRGLGATPRAALKKMVATVAIITTPARVKIRGQRT